MLTKVSLFSGIGGDDLASDWAGIKTIAFCERDKYCQKILKKHWPDVPIIEDVKDVTKERIRQIVDNASGEGLGQQYNNTELPQRIQSQSSKSSDSIVQGDRYQIDIISGGFPCQPHSCSGKRKGSADERNLWPEFRRIIGEIRPRWVVAENVPGLFSSDAGRFFGEILADLASLGHAVGWCCYGAVDVGAKHRRDRVFIVAYANINGFKRGRDKEGGSGLARGEAEIPLTWNITCSKLEEWEKFNNTFGSSRRYDGLPRQLARCGIKALGNAVVPQQIYPIYQAIVEIENNGGQFE